MDTYMVVDKNYNFVEITNFLSATTTTNIFLMNFVYFLYCSESTNQWSLFGMLIFIHLLRWHQHCFHRTNWVIFVLTHPPCVNILFVANPLAHAPSFCVEFSLQRTKPHSVAVEVCPERIERCNTHVLFQWFIGTDYTRPGTVWGKKQEGK